MHPIRHYLMQCLEEGIVRESPLRDVYFTPSLLRDRLRSVRPESSTTPPLEPMMSGSDFFIGTYEQLDTVREVSKFTDPGSWDETDIHHIVENHHLQYLSRVDAVNETTYLRFEPCVVFIRSHHRLVIDNAVGVAERLVLETAKFDFVTGFRAAHKGLSKEDRGQKALLKMEWLRKVAADRKVDRLVVQREVRDALLAIYDQAYQEADLRPLKLIARSVISSMPL